MSRPRLGFLGVGWIGRSRMEAILATDTADVVAISDPDADMAAAAKAILPSAALVPSLEAMLALAPDGVVIATPSALHASQCIQALQSGASVFCQKPLGRNAAEVEQVVAIAKMNDRLLGVDLSYRCTAAVQAIREHIRAGTLGEVYAANLVFHNAYGPDKAWFRNPALSGGGCMIDLGVHLVDLALWLFDFPAIEQVSSHLFSGGRTLARGEVEDYAVASLDLANGANVQIACSWHLPAGCDAVISAEFYGTRTGAAMRNQNGSFYDFTAELFTGTQSQILTEPPDAWPGRAAADWARGLAAGDGFAKSTSGLLETAHALDEIYHRAHAPHTRQA
ncbi:Gfo/Idh/MocA family protein [Sphingosinicella rhizophila]|uniref:Gfo/Idh/MocA family oxidoreductase n=1 Tax=Sphingosinicella rhizophila TaxID=3050082 RepID=A0ABU3QAG7_9SPHN|nr:Gfo/Idh/MocA family oxidoreductase [Sphingosinicella sp. GR2756]MDT9600383.1 Gfo/Idh/MocA family oxidoreductase [Sphingosinicella sp. GR2756]